MHPGRVDEARRQAERTGVHRRLHLPDHRREVVPRGRRRVRAQHRPSDRALTDEECDVWPERPFRDKVQVFPERPL